MRAITNFAEVHAVLAPYVQQTPNIKTAYDLTNITELLRFLGNPQDTFRTVHVAGTSGKTSTCYYIAAALKVAGFKVGLTVSPHIDEVNERVQINMVALPEAEFAREFTTFLELVEQSSVEPTYFELLVAFAFWEFAKQRVDYAVIEVGLGGLLDGTNTITRSDKLCVITDIGLDHTEVLGDTIPEITVQKAGIIRAGNDVFMYEQGPEVMDVITKVCNEKNARLHIASLLPEITDMALPLFQQRNLGLAVQAVNFILERDNRPTFTVEQIKQVAQTLVLGRMETHKVAGKTLIIDGAHNAQKMAALVDSVRAAYTGQPVAALVAFVDGPEDRWQGGLAALLPIVNKLIITSFEVEQDMPKHSVNPSKLQNFCKSQHGLEPHILPKPSDAFRELLQSSEPLLLVAGSFYLLNSIRPLIVET
jgi:dihydrofolate synthase/folylpolyglutamate synthase